MMSMSFLEPLTLVCASKMTNALSCERGSVCCATKSCMLRVTGYKSQTRAQIQPKKKKSIKRHSPCNLAFLPLTWVCFGHQTAA